MWEPRESEKVLALKIDVWHRIRLMSAIDHVTNNVAKGKREVEEIVKDKIESQDDCLFSQLMWNGQRVTEGSV